MKKLILCLLLAIAIPVSAFADEFFMVSDFGADTKGTATISLAGTTGKQIEIYSIVAKSDLSTSVILIGEGDIPGSAPNSYNTKLDHDLGNASVALSTNNGAPIFIGLADHQVQVEVDSTGLNSVSVIYKLR